MVQAEVQGYCDETDIYVVALNNISEPNESYEEKVSSYANLGQY